MNERIDRRQIADREIEMFFRQRFFVVVSVSLFIIRFVDSLPDRFDVAFRQFFENPYSHRPVENGDHLSGDENETDLIFFDATVFSD